MDRKSPVSFGKYILYPGDIPIGVLSGRIPPRPEDVLEEGHFIETPDRSRSYFSFKEYPDTPKLVRGLQERHTIFPLASGSVDLGEEDVKKRYFPLSEEDLIQLTNEVGVL